MVRCVRNVSPELTIPDSLEIGKFSLCSIMCSMNKVLSVYKPIGTTPLELIEELRLSFPEYQDVTIGYAGRLDPMAHGVMLLMLGEATKERDTYLHLEKVYEFEVLFGCDTDTYDVLGLLQKNATQTALIVNEKVNIFVKKHTGTIVQAYPPYSSKTVGGKPLFWWARNGKLSEIDIPKKEVTVFDFAVTGFDQIQKTDLKKRIIEMIERIKGDFRQEEIQKAWEIFFMKHHVKTFQTAKFRISCSSGTYVRGLVNELGAFLGTGAIALDIKRTQVGAYTIESTLRLSHTR